MENTKDIKMEILEDFGVIGEDNKGDSKRFIRVSWYGKTPVYEIRAFAKDGTPKKRLGMSPEELKKLRDILNKMEL